MGEPMTKTVFERQAVVDKAKALRQAAAQLADRLLLEGKIKPSERARVIRMCTSQAAYRATVDYYSDRLRSDG